MFGGCCYQSNKNIRNQDNRFSTLGNATKNKCQREAEILST